MKMIGSARWNHVFFASTMLALVISSQAAYSSATAINQYLSGPQLVGKARMKVMLWDVFDAELYTESGQFDESQPFALKLSYLRTLKGRKIVQKTLLEIQRQDSASSEQMKKWRSALNQIIPNVGKGTTITGVRTHDAHTVFYKDDTYIGLIEDPQFTRLFFNIWLGANSSEPVLRNTLLGGKREL